MIIIQDIIFCNGEKMIDKKAFLLLSRDVIRDIVEIELKDRKTKYNLNKLNEFIFDTLTDSQILYILLTEKLNMNIKNEDISILFHIVLEENKEFISEIIGKENTEKFLLEVHPPLINLPGNLKRYGTKIGDKKALLKYKDSLAHLRNIKYEKIKTLMNNKYFDGISLSAQIALMFASAYVKYREHLSRGKILCNSREGEEKTLCLENIKKEAFNKQKNELRKSVNLCNKSKNPDRCKVIIKNKIKKVNEKIFKIGK